MINLHYKGCWRSSKGKIYKTLYLRLRLRSSAEGLIFWNENFGFGLMSKIRLRSYSDWKIKKWCCHQFHVEKCFVDDWINFSWSSLPWFSSVPRCTNYFLGVRSESMTLLRCQSKRKTGFPVIICRALPSLRTENHFPLQLALELRGRSLTILTRCISLPLIQNSQLNNFLLGMLIIRQRSL